MHEEWFRKVTVGQKIAAICSLFTLPVGVALYLIVAGYERDLGAARKEKSGTAYERPLIRLLELTPLHADAVLSQRAGAQDQSSRAAALRADVDAAFESLAAVDAKYGEELEFTSSGLAGEEARALPGGHVIE